MKRYSFILLLALIISASCSKNTTKEATAVTSADTTVSVYRVKTIVLEKQQVPRIIEYTANLLAYEEINYAPASPGRIEKINVEVGSRVSKGDVIVEMDKTQLIQAKEQYLNAKSNFERMDTLRKLNSISELQYETTKTQFEMAKTNYDFLIRNTTLVSPINGIVTGKYFESRELYSGAPNTMAGKAAIVTLMQISPLKAKINVSEKYFPFITKGMKASVSVDIYSGKQFAGEVFRVYPTITAETRTFPVELVINNPGEILRPGMFARVTLDLGKRNVLVVPAIALVKQEGTNDRYLFVAGDDNKAQKIFIEPGDRYDDKIEIMSGKIKEGDHIIYAGQDKLMDGSAITVVQ